MIMGKMKVKCDKGGNSDLACYGAVILWTYTFDNVGHESKQVEKVTARVETQ